MPYPHIVYICAAYVVTTVIVAAMIAAIMIDKRALERDLARLALRVTSKDAEARDS